MNFPASNQPNRRQEEAVLPNWGQTKFGVPPSGGFRFQPPEGGTPNTNFQLCGRTI